MPGALIHVVCSGEPDLAEGDPAPELGDTKDVGSSIPSTVFNLTNTIIGAGALHDHLLLQIIAFLNFIIESSTKSS